MTENTEIAGGEDALAVLPAAVLLHAIERHRVEALQKYANISTSYTSHDNRYISRAYKARKAYEMALHSYLQRYESDAAEPVADPAAHQRVGDEVLDAEVPAAAPQQQVHPRGHQHDQVLEHDLPHGRLIVEARRDDA